MLERSLEITLDDDHAAARPTRLHRAPRVALALAVPFGDEPTLESPRWPGHGTADAEDELTCLLPTKATLPPPPAHPRRATPPDHSPASFERALGARASMRSETGLTRFDARAPAARVGSSPPPAVVIHARRNASSVAPSQPVAGSPAFTSPPTKQPRAATGAVGKILALVALAATATWLAPGGPRRWAEVSDATASFAVVAAQDVLDAGVALGLTEGRAKRAPRSVSARTAPLPHFALRRGAFPPAS